MLVLLLVVFCPHTGPHPGVVVTGVEEQVTPAKVSFSVSQMKESQLPGLATGKHIPT